MRTLGKLLGALLLVLAVVAFMFKDRVSDLIAQASPIDYKLQTQGVVLPSSLLAEDAPWQSLFNGSNLEGWTPKFTGFAAGKNYRNTFRASNGVLSVDYRDWTDFNGEFGHLVSDEVFSHYLLRFEYRFIGDQVTDDSRMAWATRNNGAMLHSQSAPSMSIEQDFPVSIEAQLLGGLGKEQGERATANLCTPATNVELNGEIYRAHCTPSVSKTFHGDQWVKAEFEVLGAERLRHFINGKLVFEYSRPQYDPYSKNSKHIGKTEGLLESGHIAFQAESHPTEFRNIEILTLQ